MKICSRKDCDFKGEKQPLQNFNKRYSARDGRDSECRSCKNKRANFHNKNSSIADKEFFKIIFG